MDSGKPSLKRLVWASSGAVLLGWGACTGAAAADFTYTVQPGDHPWNLALRYLKSPGMALQLRRLNRIADDQRIAPGTRLRIPEQWLRLESREVRLLAASGEVSVVPTGAAPRAALAGELLKAPAVLRTGPTGSASLRFDDGSRVLVLRDSELRLRQADASVLAQARVIVLDLLRGGLENDVQARTDAGGRFEIHTPAATAAVRGTNFRVRLQDGAEMPTVRTEVLQGAVQVGNAAGADALAQAGQGSLARAGQAPEAPVALLAAPDLAGVPERIERLPIDLPLTPLEGARAYRTQIAPGTQFDVAVSDETSTAARIRARDIEDGSYVLRVRAVDGRGLEGLAAQRVLVVHARPEPPLLIAPAPDATTTAARPTFQWTQGQAGVRYRLQVHAQGATEPLLDLTTEAQQARPEVDLLPGIYQWRLASIDTARGQGPWSDAQTLRTVPPGPAMEAPQTQPGSLLLRWAAQGGAQRYSLQIAPAPDFAQPLVDTTADTPQYAVQGLAPGTYHVRIRAIGADGYTGPWGSTQSFTVAEPPPPERDWRWLWLLLPLLGAL